MNHSITTLLAKSGQQLGNIMAKAGLLQRIQIQVNQLMAPELSEFTKVANYEHQCLTLLCKNAAIATRLRYFIPTLMQQLRTTGHLPGLANIKLKIARAEPLKPTYVSANPPVLTIIAKQQLNYMRKQLQESHAGN